VTHAFDSGIRSGFFAYLPVAICGLLRRIYESTFNLVRKRASELSISCEAAANKVDAEATLHHLQSELNPTVLAE
jgi:hypothetical protein